MLRFAERLFPWLAAVIAIAFVSIAIDEFFYQTGPRPHRLESTVWAVVISVPFALAAASIWLRWRAWRLFVYMCTGCLALFIISTLVQSWEKVSVAGGVILLTFATIAFVLGLFAGAKRSASMTPPNTSLERTRGR